ncbi:short-chain dehydrogenase [Trichoderma arundinaceum]|uniref:Short-chain dehydrogenase n=1 Tax=Trichoderma arundinaceum TaxID=490622 RepID=A0A395NUQ1_TRIAR|nr:short-chain dehydrogenase [Trichoderma arundinaceum]
MANSDATSQANTQRQASETCPEKQALLSFLSEHRWILNIYIAARSEEKATAAINSIRNAHPSSTGHLRFLKLDLADLESVTEAAKSFLASAKSLDVLFNNAGVMHPPEGSKTKQDYELQLGVHNIGAVQFTELLTLLLAKTASNYSTVGKEGCVRVIWVSSLTAERSPPGGVDLESMDYSKKHESKYTKYSVSKAGVYYQGTEYARRHKHEGIISVPLNPGNLKSDLQRHHPGLAFKVVNATILYPAINVIPWGRFAKIRSDLDEGSRSISEGGTGIAEKWYDWCLE